jgi:hypothetical protein
MKAVSRFEYNLLKILHFLLGRLQFEQVRTILIQNFDKERPTCLSASSVALIQDALAKGVVLSIARQGGWNRERFLRGGRSKLGRLWERSSPADLGLTYSGWTLDFLMWLTAVKPVDSRSAWQPPPNDPTAGDLFFLTLAYDTLRRTDLAPVLRKMDSFSKNGLCRLLFVSEFTLRDKSPPPDFSPWMSGPGSAVMEAIQPALVKAWLDGELMKSDIADWQQMRRVGRSQEQTLNAFLTAIERAGRTDLARFLLRALAVMLDDRAEPRRWVGGLQAVGPKLADRVETHKAALVVVRLMERFRRWHGEARLQSVHDENFGQAQLWLADWEHYQGEVLHRRATEIIRQLDPLR